MQIGHIVVIGNGGLLGEIMAGEFARYGPVATASSWESPALGTEPAPDVVVVWADAASIGRIRKRLRQVMPADADPLLVFLSQRDPNVYITWLRELHVDRCRLGFHDVFDTIANRLRAGAATTTPVRTGSITGKV